MNIDSTQRLLYKEEQFFRERWLLLLMLAASAVIWYAFIQQIIFDQPVGNNTASDSTIWIIWIFVGIGFPLIIYSSKLLVEVFVDRILINYFPFLNLKIYFEQIDKIEVVTYNFIKECWAWITRRHYKGRRAYTIGGNIGLEISLTNGKTILLGSENPEILYRIISNKLNAVSE